MWFRISAVIFTTLDFSIYYGYAMSASKDVITPFYPHPVVHPFFCIIIFADVITWIKAIVIESARFVVREWQIWLSQSLNYQYGIHSFSLHPAYSPNPLANLHKYGGEWVCVVGELTTTTVRRDLHRSSVVTAHDRVCHCQTEKQTVWALIIKCWALCGG